MYFCTIVLPGYAQTSVLSRQQFVIGCAEYRSRFVDQIIYKSPDSMLLSIRGQLNTNGHLYVGEQVIDYVENRKENCHLIVKRRKIEGALQKAGFIKVEEKRVGEMLLLKYTL